MTVMKERCIVSACLAGISCRYNGKGAALAQVRQLIQQGLALPVCPEQLGGLPTPRASCELVSCGKRGYRILTAKGQDYTKNFLAGARQAYELAKLFGAQTAILKTRSPSCGCGTVYNGTFSGIVTEGWGTFAQLLREKSFKLLTEEDLEFLDVI